MKNPVIPGLHEFGEIQFSLLYVYMYMWGRAWLNLTGQLSH